MVKCERCQQEFPFQWRLDRHLARKFPCKKIKVENSSDKVENSSDEVENSSDKVENTSDEVENSSDKVVKCQFCCKIYSSTKYKNIHEETCKLKDDHVRCLEMKLNIDFEAVSPQHCRFCNTTFSKANIARHLIRCKAKQDYRAKLEKQLEEKSTQVTAQTINNTTNNNNCHNTNVTINMNAFGKENLEYISRNVILKLCRKANLLNEIIPRLARQIHCNPEHPENHNIVVSNLRAPYAKVYDGENYTVESTKDIIDKVMDNVTGLLTDQQCDDDDRKFLQYDRVITRIESEIGDVESKFKSEQRIKVKNSLYNNKNMLEKTMKSKLT